MIADSDMIAYIETVDLWKSRAYSDSVRISIKSHGRTFKVAESVRVTLIVRLF